MTTITTTTATTTTMCTQQHPQSRHRPQGARRQCRSTDQWRKTIRFVRSIQSMTVFFLILLLLLLGTDIVERIAVVHSWTQQQQQQQYTNPKSIPTTFHTRSSHRSILQHEQFIPYQRLMIIRSATTPPTDDNNNSYHSNADHTLISEATRISRASSSSSTSQAVSSSSSSSSAAAALLVWEESLYVQLQHYYNQAMTIKCPFFRRRTSDLLDMIDMILQFIIITRHKSLSLSSLSSTVVVISPPKTDTTVTLPSSLSSSSSSSIGMTLPPSRLGIQPSSQQLQKSYYKINQNIKLYHLPLTEIVSILQHDWDYDTTRIDDNSHNNNNKKRNKGYYITGRITTHIYADTTIFDSPDPDMPVRGLYKYIQASSQLFDIPTSYATLRSIEILPHTTTTTTATTTTTDVPSHNNNDLDQKIVAHWKIGGRLRLPWKPIVPEWTGTTTYYISKQTGLIHRHVETWDISVVQAFLQTLLPQSITKYIF